MINYRIDFQYDGTDFYGSQKQNYKRTVQGVLLKYLKDIFQDISTLTMSGRTDRYVHANHQVLNFHTNQFIDNHKLVYALNNLLPNDILVTDASVVDKTFDARRSAISREYLYVFSCELIPVYLKNYVSSISHNFNLSIAQILFDYLVGEHDFKLFCKTGSQPFTTIKHIYSINYDQTEYKLLTDSKKKIKIHTIKVKGNSFLYGMVRNIIGSMFYVIQNNLNMEDLIEAFKQKKRNFNFKPADPQGLYLNKILY